MNVRITQIDGELPNLALMKIAHWHKSQGDDVNVTRHIEPDMFEPPQYDRVYGSAIFKFSADRVDRFRRTWPGALLGGTGTDSKIDVEAVTGADHNGHDYSGWPNFSASIGFTQRGCRLKCKFCVVPAKEGKPRAVATVEQIWRGDPWPRHLHILDNDFFGQPREQWEARIREMRDGRFRVCMSQGVNVRLITSETAQALASIEYRDTKFRERRLYTAWDNLQDEAVFFRGVEQLERAGIRPSNLMAYMLIGFDKAETWERIWHRFNRMVAAGILPFPMVYDRARADLRCFQRWAVTGLYRAVPWNEYRHFGKSTESVEAWERTVGPLREVG